MVTGAGGAGAVVVIVVAGAGTMATAAVATTGSLASLPPRIIDNAIVKAAAPVSTAPTPIQRARVFGERAVVTLATTGDLSEWVALAVSVSRGGCATRIGVVSRAISGAVIGGRSDCVAC